VINPHPNPLPARERKLAPFSLSGRRVGDEGERKSGTLANPYNKRPTRFNTARQKFGRRNVR